MNINNLPLALQWAPMQILSLGIAFALIVFAYIAFSFIGVWLKAQSSGALVPQTPL